MLQRQIMFKQLQELQRRQQLQELGNSRNQNYGNQPSSLKQASGGQFPLSDNGLPLQDSSRMFIVGNNMQMMQHGGPTGLVRSQSSHNASPLGLPQQQFDVSLYRTHVSNSDQNLSQYPHLQAPSSLSVDLPTTNNDSPLGMGAMQPFTSRRCNFSSDQISSPYGSLQSNQEKNFFGQVPVEDLNCGILSGNYSQQGIAMQRNASLVESEGRHEDAGWDGRPPGKTSNLDLFQTAASLDPLEQKILYDSNDNSWSALMQSAVEETSTCEPGMQEEWSGLSFQNPEPLNDNQPPNFTHSEKLQSNWVDRNLQNASSPSSKPEHLFQNFNMNSNFTNFQQSDHQNPKQREEYHSEVSNATTQHSPRNTSQLADYNSQQRHPTGVSHLIQTSLPPPNIWPAEHREHSNNDAHRPSNLSCTSDNQPRNNFSGQEFKGTFGLQGNTSHHVLGGIQKPYDQASHLNAHGYSSEPENMASGENVGDMSTFLGSSLQRHGESVTAPSESMIKLFNKDDISSNPTPAMQLNSEVSIHRELRSTENSVASFAKPSSTSPMSPDFGFRLGHADPRTPQSYSFFPSLSMGISNATSLSTHNLNDHTKNQHPDPPVTSQKATEFAAYNASFSKDTWQHATPDIATQKDMSSPKSYKFSNLFRSPDPASNSLETSSATLNEQHNQNAFQHEYNILDSGKYSGKSESHEQGFEQGSTLHEGLSEVNHSTPLSRNTHKQEFMRKRHLEEDTVGSDSLMTNMHQQPSIQAEGMGKETLARDSEVFHHSLGQNYSLLNQVYSAKNAETDGAKSFPPKYDNVIYQQSIANAGELFLSGQKSVSQHGALLSEGNNGLNFSQEAQADQLGKASSTAYQQNPQQMDIFCQNNTQNRIIASSNEASNLTYQSQISLQMAPSWFKHYGTLTNGQMFPMYDPRAAVSAAQPLPKMNLGKLQENSLMMQVHLANASQGSAISPSTAANSLVSKQINPPCVFPSDINYINSAVTIAKKRKFALLDMVPWHREVNHKQSRLQDISDAELAWAHASNRIQEEVKNEADIAEELTPVTRAKRRLICTTQLMQLVFPPSPAVILRSDTSSGCDSMAYFAARLELGVACSLAYQPPYDTSDIPPNKLKISKRTNTCEFSKAVEGFINQVKKLEGDLSRLDKSLSFVDIKVEAQELEKFSIINRFAKFHIKAHPSTANPASSSGTPALYKANLQRYVAAVPMPRVVPEGLDCLSL